MLKGMFTSKDLSKVKAIPYGKSEEKFPRSVYAKKIQMDTVSFAVFNAGISVDPTIPLKGPCSP